MSVRLRTDLIFVLKDLRLAIGFVEDLRLFKDDDIRLFSGVLRLLLNAINLAVARFCFAVLRAIRYRPQFLIPTRKTRRQ